MSINESELNTLPEGGQAATPSEGTMQDQISGSLQDNDNQTPSDAPFWHNHDNYKKGFWKSEQDVLNSVDFYSKKFKPFETILGQRGIKDPDGLTEVFKKYDEYSNPDSEVNSTYARIQNLINHPTYGPEFTNFIQQIAEKEEIAKYGQRIPPEIRKQLQEVQDLKKWKEDQEYNSKVSTYGQELDKTCNSIKEFCGKYNLDFAEQEYLNYCLEEGIGLNQMYDHFVTLHLEDLLGNVQSKASQAVVDNINKNSRSSIPSGTKTTQTAPVPITSRHELSKQIGKALSE